ncbi:MAG: hypothetical protein NTZ83_04260 [Candidatus Pacearchaeota archaeon]|nr:hypothetical protein [Candidatus Pacearchaeota archaeon]
MEPERLIDYIKEARRRGFRDDVIKKSLLDKGLPESEIDDAFLNSGKRKRADPRYRTKTNLDNSKNSITILLEDWLKDAIEKKAEADGLTPYNEVKKILVENTPADVSPEVKRKTRIRKKLTEEEKAQHRIVDREYKERVRKERKKKARMLKKKERRRG